MAQAGSQPTIKPTLDIERAGEVPIGVQLAWSLRAQIGAGQLAPGQRLPGVRALAELAGVNANTARAVYQRLEREGLIESRQGTGTFVADSPTASAAGELAREVALQARELGMDPRDVAAALYVGVEGSGPGDDGPARRRRLRSQIAALEQALAELAIGHPGLLGPPRAALPMAGPRLLSAEELEEVRDRLVRRLTDARLTLDEQATETSRASHGTLAKSNANAAAKTPKRISGRGRTQGAAQTSAKAPKPSARPRPATRPSTA